MQKYKLNYDKDRVAEAKERVSNWYNDRPVDRAPFEFRLNFKPLCTKGERARSIDKAIEARIYELNTQLTEFPDSDYIPYLNVGYLGEGMIPSMFGAKQLIVENNSPFTEGRVIDDLERDILKLKIKIDPENDGWGPILKETIHKFLDATNGEVAVAVCDHQSPYGVATKLVGNEELMLAMYDTPELVHELMEISTNAIIDTVRAIEKWVGDPKLFVKNVRCPVSDCGLIIWDDYISVISPELHKEFCLPYNLKLYEVFGKGHLHTCGPYFPGFVDAIFAHHPKSIDISILRNKSKTREDMLLLKEYADKHRVKLTGRLVANPIGIHDFDSRIYPDDEFARRMLEGRNLYWIENGSKELGLHYMKLIK